MSGARWHTGDMHRRGLALVVLATTLALAGCAPAASPDPMSDHLRSAVLQTRADREWQRLTTDYPEALRPDVTVGPVVTDVDWARETKECFNQGGFQVKQDGPEFKYSSSSGQSQLDFVVAQYVCAVQVPRVNEVAVYLDKYQLGDLYDYYTTKVRPCLVFNGQHPTAAPERSVWVDQYFSYLWHPYDAVWKADPDASALASLEKRCPPVPTWLHL